DRRYTMRTNAFYCLSCSLFFFFSSRRRHTMSKRDWSSDVCSSDLLMKFELPAAEVAEEVEENQTLVFFNLPLTSTVPNFAKKVVASGIEVHENLGDSDTPYITWDLDMDTKKLAQVMYLKASK